MTASAEGPTRDRVGEVLHAAMELPVEQRQSFVDRVCAEDLMLHAEVSSLLAHTGPGDDFFASLSAEIGNQTSAQGDPTPGSRVGPYRIEERLGGGVTSVFRAVDSETGEAVALKFGGSSAGNMSASDIDARMRLEARVLQRLTHPAVCRLVGTGSTLAGRFYLVLEYIDGDALHHRTVVQALAPEIVAAGAADIAAALGEAHAQRIIHRDLKPANIMIDRAHTLRILDFGAAKTDDVDLTAPGHTIGTLEYMSPEQLRGGRVTAATDIWSFSVLLWEALYGVHPFRAGSRRETLAAITEAELQDPGPTASNTIAVALSELLRSGLGRNPEQRPSAADFAANARRIAGGARSR